jgi:hypothetical protein
MEGMMKAWFMQTLATFSGSDALAAWMIGVLGLGVMSSWESSAVLGGMVGGAVGLGLLYGTTFLPCVRKWR